MFGFVRETSVGDSLFATPANVLIAYQALPEEVLPSHVLFEALFTPEKDTLAIALTYVNNPSTDSEIISIHKV